jgi:hypothetical protein
MQRLKVVVWQDDEWYYVSKQWKALSLRKDGFVHDRAFVANAHSPFFAVSSIEVPWSYPFVSPFCT